MKAVKVIFYLVVIALLSTILIDFQGTLDKVENFIVNIHNRTAQTLILGEAVGDMLKEEINREYGKEGAEGELAKDK